MGALVEALRQLESRSSETTFADPSFDQALALADAAILAADAVDSIDDADIRPAVEISTAEPIAAEIDTESYSATTNSAPMADFAVGPAISDPLAAVSVDRSYGRLWDRLTAALVEPPPWAIVVAGGGSHDVAWMLPMAVAFAQRHSGNVLLVDASVGRERSGQTKNASRANAANAVDASADYDEFGKMSLSEHLGLHCRFGVADVLRSTADWRDAVEPTAVPRIGLLASGRIGSVADSALRANAANLIDDLKARYQLILIWAADTSDPLVAPLAAVSDGTLLLLELGRTSRAAAERASSSLFLAGARMLGCAVRG